MKNNKLISLILALLVCFSLVLTVSATTDNNLTLAVEASASTVVSGDTIKVTIKTNENSGFLYFNFTMNWDTNVLEYVPNSVSSSGSPYAGQFLKVEPRPDSGSVFVSIGDLNAAIFGASTKYTASGLIAELTFKVKDGTPAGKVLSLSDKINLIYAPRVTSTKLSEIKSSVSTLTVDKPHTCTSTKEATCTEAKKCDICGKVLAPAAGHKPGAAATCTTDQTCTVCSTVLVAGGHKEIVLNAVAATCQTTGLTEGKKCSVCNTVLVAQTTVEKTGHTPGKLSAKKATCTTSGLTEGEECTVCHGILKAQETVAATGHNWSDAWTNSSSSGHWKSCKNCGEKKDSASHSLSDGVCTVCGYGCKHNGGTATCKDQAICATCSKPYGDLLDHTPGAVATCANDQVCTVCNAVVVEKLGHQLTTVEAQAATCGEAGWNKYEKCSNCDYTTFKEIPATGTHTFGEWTVVTEATANAAGEQIRTCSVCGETESQEISPLKAPAVPVVWIVILVVLVAAMVVVIILIKKRKN